MDRLRVVVGKMWKSLREKLWVSCGKVSTVCVESGFCTEFDGFLHIGLALVEKFCIWFSTLVDLCFVGGFAQFPQSLLQLLLIY